MPELIPVLASGDVSLSDTAYGMDILVQNAQIPVNWTSLAFTS